MWLRKGKHEFGTVNAVTVAAAAELTTDDPHGLVTGQTVDLENFVTTPDINGEHIITVTGANTYTIPITTTVVTDGIGDWTRLLDINDNVANSAILLSISDNFFSAVQILKSVEFLNNEKINIMCQVSDLSITLAAEAAAGGIPAVPSIILSMVKEGG